MSTSQAVPGRTAETDAARPRRAGALRAVLGSEHLVLGLTLLCFLGFWASVPEIATAATLLDILAAAIPLLVVAVGQTFVLIAAGIDLSATAVLAFASVVAGSVMTQDGGPLEDSALAMPAALVAFLAVGLGIGLINGLCITGLGMPAFIVTLTTMMFFAGGALFYTANLTDDGSSFGSLPGNFVMLGQGTFHGVPYSLAAAAAVMLVAHLLLSRTLWGRRLYAVGLNPRAAAISGVPVGRVVMIAYVLSGLCAAIASGLYTGRLETGTPVLGQRILLDVIGAAVIGGVSLFGGRGRVIWTLWGVLFLSVIDKGLQLLGLDIASVFAIKGGVILLAAVMDALRRRWSMAA